MMQQYVNTGSEMSQGNSVALLAAQGLPMNRLQEIAVNGAGAGRTIHNDGTGAIIDGRAVVIAQLAEQGLPKERLEATRSATQQPVRESHAAQSTRAADIHKDGRAMAGDPAAMKHTPEAGDMRKAMEQAGKSGAISGLEKGVNGQGSFANAAKSSETYRGR